MLWLYVLVVTVLVLPTIAVGIGTLRNGYEMWGVSQVMTPVAWVAISVVAVHVSRRMKPGALKAFTQTTLVTMALVGAVLGQLFGLVSGLAFNYGANQTDLALGHAAFFGLGTAIALVPGILFGGIAVIAVKFIGKPRPNQTSNTQES
jgi:hypothetical protein